VLLSQLLYVLSQDVEPTCDLELIKRDWESFVAGHFSYPEWSCAKTLSTIEIVSRNGESGGSGGTEMGSGGGSNTTNGQDSVNRSASPPKFGSVQMLSFLGSVFAVAFFA
jgi:hypothetical protein